MVSVRDVIRYIASVGAGIGTAVYSFAALQEAKKRTPLNVLIALSVGSGIGFLGNTIGKLISDWKDSDFSFYLPINKKPPVSRKPYPKHNVEQNVSVFRPITADYIVGY